MNPTGILLVQIVEARNLTVPPAALQQVQQNVSSNAAASVSTAAGKAWWLPYAIVEFDKNQIQTEAIGGNLQSPVWKSRVNL
jgi:serum/glucocorticoid-regulated kinase 2